MHDDLTKPSWDGKDGSRALEFMIDLSGLRSGVFMETAGIAERSTVAEIGFTKTSRVRAF